MMQSGMPLYGISPYAFGFCFCILVLMLSKGSEKKAVQQADTIDAID
jgi:hypothetical protein